MKPFALFLVSVPVLLESALPDILGRLTFGFLDDRLATEFNGSEIASETSIVSLARRLLMQAPG